jgi:hypothetical protein
MTNTPMIVPASVPCAAAHRMCRRFDDARDASEQFLSVFPCWVLVGMIEVGTQAAFMEKTPAAPQLNPQKV